MANWYDNIPAPTDADGRVVPLDTKELVCEGETLEVYGFDYSTTLKDWFVEFEGRGDIFLGACTMPDKLRESGAGLMTTTSDGWDTRIPYRLGTDHYCEFEDDGGFVHMGDLIEVSEYVNDCDGNTCGNIYSGRLRGVRYNYNGFISEVTLSDTYEDPDFDIEFDGIFYRASEVKEHDD